MLMPSIFDGSLVDDFFDNFAMPKNENNFYYGSLMRTDIKQTDTSYELDIDLPGMKKDDVRIELKDGYLTVTASRDENKDQKDEKGRYIRRERYAGKAERSYYVGSNLTQEDVHAKFENGILKISFPKEKPAKAEEEKFITIE